jgi:hypothetical protein
VITEDGVWRIRKREKVPKLEVYKLEESGHGDILSENFVHWRTYELPRYAEAKVQVPQSLTTNDRLNGATDTWRAFSLIWLNFRNFVLRRVCTNDLDHNEDKVLLTAAWSMPLPLGGGGPETVWKEHVLASLQRESVDLCGTDFDRELPWDWAATTLGWHYRTAHATQPKQTKEELHSHSTAYLQKDE